MFRPFYASDIPYYIGLVFLAFPYMGAFYYDYPKWTLIITTLFIVAYLVLIHLRDKYQKTINLLWLYLLFYVAYMTCLSDGNMIWFFFFHANLLIWRFDNDIQSFRGLTFLLVFFGTFIYLWSHSQSLSSRVMLVAIALFIVGLTYMNMWLQREDNMKAAISKQNQEINFLMAENERNRIGRDLHDTLGHTFALMTIKTELAIKQLQHGRLQAVEKELTELHQISRRSMEDVRQLVNNVTFRSLSEEMVVTSDLFDLSGIQFTFEKKISDDQLSPLLQSTLVMLVRELATNVIKHAKASHCQLSLYRQDTHIILQMEDDGIGFKDVEVPHSINERLLLVKGKVELSSLKKPTIITIYLNEGMCHEIINC
ncbi:MULTISPECIES: sensor histidine kinase [Streptococcus]|uniref:sensor histidine kinase n=1 Tax=Streptococcus TaxID=1301 RepID=UPI000617F5AA|nr:MULTISPECIES: sensor histidine kinase [Streptococcus]KKC16410.1 histidine kinase [Streptococcus dysgalactiae subsp. equisimilis]MCY7234175.1 sensor histidine kinase [Streptococcus dysgalactiae]QQC49373.1 sensor histidine kinase [Streptococcus dysgalactiae]SUN65760.1 two-component system sensor histidine kinase [Streptococcus dysgalactiae subsp. equisimilis]VTY14217.1 Sensor histidine kinase DesK [Streptococcus dysgalactiae]